MTVARCFVTLSLVTIAPFIAVAQGSQDVACKETKIVVRSNGRAEAPLTLINAGAATAMVNGAQRISADTITVSTPATLILPCDAFTLAVAVTASHYTAQVGVRPTATGSDGGVLREYTMYTPFTVTRTSVGGPLVWDAMRMTVEKAP